MNPFGNKNKGASAIEKVKGKNHPYRKAASLATADSGKGRQVVIARKDFLSNVVPEHAFEIITQKIAQVTDKRRNEVENALIMAGSPISVRKMNRKQLNAEIQNKLVERSPKAEKFRQDMATLIAVMFGKQMLNDDFFRTMPSEARVGNNGAYLPTNPVQQVDSDVSDDKTILPYSKSDTGGVTEDETPTDWGGILSGSASLINSIGGVVGMFTGGQQAQPGASAFDPYSAQAMQYQMQMEAAEQKRKARMRNIIIAVVIGVVAIVGIIVAVNYYRKNKGKSK